MKRLFTERRFICYTLLGLVLGFVVCILTVDYRITWIKGLHNNLALHANDHTASIGKNIYFHDLIPNSDEHAHNDDTSVAEALSKKVRVLCWVMTMPDNFRSKADAVKHTWGKRCNILLFFSSEPDEHLQTIALDVEEGRQHLTAKTMQAFRYVYEHHYNDADWFMKCDDDTYVIVENLRYFLSSKNTSEPVFYGHHFRTLVKQGYFSGGAGYVLSKEALKRLSDREDSLCKSDGGAEDVAMGKCMEKLGIITGNSTDSLGRSRFHCLKPDIHVHGNFPNWYYDYDSAGAKSGIDNISDYAISFHYINPKNMMMIEFFMYHLRPYGIIADKQDLN